MCCFVLIDLGKMRNFQLYNKNLGLFNTLIYIIFLILNYILWDIIIFSLDNFIGRKNR